MLTFHHDAPFYQVYPPYSRFMKELLTKDIDLTEHNCLLEPRQTAEPLEVSRVST